MEQKSIENFSNLNKYIGERIRKIRKEQKLTQENIAQEINISRKEIINIEKGKRGLSLETLINICNVLNCTPNDLFNKYINKIKNAKKPISFYLTDENKLVVNKFSKFLLNEQKEKMLKKP